MNPEPHQPQEHQFLGGGGSAPSGPASPALGDGPALPGAIRRDLFDKLVANGPKTASRIAALVKQAHDLAATGADLNALAELSLQMGWKRFALPPRPDSSTRAKKPATDRARGRAAALVVLPDTRTIKYTAWGDQT